MLIRCNGFEKMVRKNVKDKKCANLGFLRILYFFQCFLYIRKLQTKQRAMCKQLTKINDSSTFLQKRKMPNIVPKVFEAQEVRNLIKVISFLKLRCLFVNREPKILILLYRKYSANLIIFRCSYLLECANCGTLLQLDPATLPARRSTFSTGSTRC